MSLLGKKFPTPIAKPMGPFFAAGVVILYGVNSAANALAQNGSRLDGAEARYAADYKNDPRNPNAKNIKH